MWDGEKWINKVEGGQRASNSASTKDPAQDKGRDMARERGVEHVIHARTTTRFRSGTPTLGAATLGAQRASQSEARRLLEHGWDAVRLCRRLDP